jgi:Transglutaminase-like superfamily
MDLRLQPGVSFCLVADRVVFLDLEPDRYFCLSPGAQQTFLRAIESDDEALIARLAAVIPLSRDPDHPPIARCPDVGEPAGSLLDMLLPCADWRSTMLAASSLVMAKARLRVCGLAGTVRHLARRKRRLPRRAAREDDLLQAVSAYSRLRYIASESDQCLPRSVAVAGRLAAMGLPAALVIGVKLQPFAAHAWVQSGDWLANDRVDVVRDFTPILIV